MTPFDQPDVDRFTAGAVGPPGQRVFYLQAVLDDQVLTYQLEKLQVAALVDHLVGVLADLPDPLPAEVPDDLELVEPVVPEWLVGQLGVAFHEEADRLVLRIDEAATDDEDDESAGVAIDGRMARFSLTRGQVRAFVVRAATLIASGRPPCPLCGRPLDPEGHMCIKTNGHKTH